MKRTLAIGDIHGCLAPLELLWKTVAPTPEDKVIFIGDYVDRGPDSKGVIDFCLGLSDELDVTFLSGNHEEKFLLANLDHTELAHWLEAWGGGATLESYGPGGFDDVPEAHWEFLRTGRLFTETETHIFVHANLEPDVELDAQLPFSMIHKKFGTPEPPPMERGWLKSEANLRKLVAHVRRVLPSTHELAEKGWTRLPRNVYSLPKEVALPDQ